VDQYKKQRVLYDILEGINYGYDDGSNLMERSDDAEMKIVIDGLKIPGGTE